MSTKTQHPLGSRNRLAGLLGTASLNAVLIVLLVNLQTFSAPTAGAQSPEVSVAEQPGVPLVISLEGFDASNPSAPRVKYRVQNISNKAIRAYTILEEKAAGSERSTGVKIVNLGKEDNFIQPMQLRPEFYDASGQSESVVNLTLSVDYIEFVDGATWGKDTRRSADYLAGQREGKKATTRKLRELRDKEGVNLEDLLKKKDAEVVSPTAGHSSEWEYGFRVGHNFALHRLRTAHAEGGLQALNLELQRESENEERGKP